MTRGLRMLCVLAAVFITVILLSWDRTVAYEMDTTVDRTVKEPRPPRDLSNHRDSVSEERDIINYVTMSNHAYAVSGECTNVLFNIMSEPPRTHDDMHIGAKWGEGLRIHITGDDYTNSYIIMGGRIHEATGQVDSASQDAAVE